MFSNDCNYICKDLTNFRSVYNRFVDAASYMQAVADGMEQAKEEIFIADWW